MFSEAMRPSGEGTEVDVSVSPGSDRPGMDGYDPWRRRIILRVAAPPADGKANAEVSELVSAITGFRSEIIRGRTSRQKTVFVHGPPGEVLGRFAAHGD
ncbi:MAG: YggU family protein [Thermoplasmatales archaeon]|nr:YggU family protein [Thermoplasmatales archaeon]